MKTHSLGKELIALGEALLRGPNIESKHTFSHLSGAIESQNETNAEMAFGITTLAQLSKYSRHEWINFARDHNISVEFNERDSSRNIMGKIMSYLENNDSEIKRVRDSISKEKESSNRLNNAFNILLRNSSS